MKQYLEPDFDLERDLEDDFSDLDFEPLRDLDLEPDEDLEREPDLDLDLDREPERDREPLEAASIRIQD